MRMHFIANVEERLTAHPNPPECWLWCDECNRFFQLKSAGKRSRWGAECPFADCTSCGIGLGLFMSDDCREPADPRWPASEDELEHGMRSPEMAEFYEAQLKHRIHVLTAEFERSPELAEDLGPEPPRYLPEFLQMLSDLCWDITDEEDDYFDAEIARELLDQLPVWGKTAELAEAPRMVAELRAFFRFATRTGRVPNAELWAQIVAAEDVEDLLKHTMRTDRRLKPAPASEGWRRAVRAGSGRRWRRSKR